jgi:hypothetical protein
MSIGNFMGDIVGGNSDYHVNNPYSQDALTQTLANSGQIFGQQQGLANMLLAQSQGQGPNPAQLQYQQNAESAIQNNAGLLASQRGLNPALAARMASQNAAQMQGTAAQNSAVMQAQQQLAAQNQLQNLYGTMGNQQLSQQGQITGANLGAQKINADVASGNAANAAKQGGSFLNGAGTAAMALLSRGGTVPGRPMVTGDSTRNDTVPAMLSPGEIVIPRSKASDPELAKEFIDHLMSEKSSAVEEKGSYRSVLEAHRKLGDAIAALEKKKGAKK